MKYKGIIIDLDDTIYNYKATHKIAFDKMMSVAIELTGHQRKDIEIAFQKGRRSTHMNLLHSAASHNRILYFHKMLEVLNVDVTFALDLYDAYWNCFIENIVIFDKALEVLIYLKNKGYSICILTDLTTHIQLRKIRALEINKHIDYVVTSEEVGVEKPSKSMFLSALHKLALLPNEVVMIGDNFEKDIIGAINLDIDSIWINGSDQLVNEKVIKIDSIKCLSEVL